jgi:Flp pilus assembly protein TadG
MLRRVFVRGGLRRKGRGQQGQALVEFALISIVFFLFIFGIFDMTRLLQSWNAVQHSARESARYAITGQQVCSDYPSGNNRGNCIVAKAKRATTGIPGGGEDSDDVSVAYRYWDYPLFAGAGTTGAGVACDQVEVAVTYRHRFATPLISAILPDGVEITGRQRMTNEPFGTCS